MTLYVKVRLECSRFGGLLTWVTFDPASECSSTSTSSICRRQPDDGIGMRYLIEG